MDWNGLSEDQAEERAEVATQETGDGSAQDLHGGVAVKREACGADESGEQKSCNDYPQHWPYGKSVYSQEECDSDKSAHAGHVSGDFPSEVDYQVYEDCQTTSDNDCGKPKGRSDAHEIAGANEVAEHCRAVGDGSFFP